MRPVINRSFPSRRRVGVVWRAVAFVLLALAVQGMRSATAHADVGDCTPEGATASVACGLHGQPFELAVEYLMDCEGTSTPPACGTPPARWTMANRPVRLCSYMANRPAWLTEAQFRQALTDAAEKWNAVEAAVGVRYVGDCTGASRWSIDNGVNEIGFDDARNAVRGSASGVTRAVTDWSPRVNPTSRFILETDVVIDDVFPNIPACFATTIAHEMGHVLGFGHSDVLGDLMYPSFDASRPASCATGPSSAERARLVELYGVDRAPTVAVSTPPVARTGVPTTVTAVGADAEAGALTYEWAQVGGAPVTLTQSGATVTFVAATPGPVQLRVTVLDPYLHRGTANIAIEVSSGTTGSAQISGSLPPSGYGLFVFSGGTEAQLVSASACPADTAAFWASDSSGGFVTFVPGTAISAVNGAWFAQFPLGVPANTPLIGRCRA